MASKNPQNQQLPTPFDAKVTMHNTLIGASHGLTLGEKRLVSMAIATLSPKSKVLPDKIRISAGDFAERFEIDPNTAYEQLRSAQESLFRRYITHIEHRGANGQKVYVRRMRWVSSIEYPKDGGEVMVAFAPEIAQFLIQLRKQFTSYQLKQAAALRSVYSWRLFENLKRFETTKTWQVSLDRFHEVMETPKSYRRNFAQVRRWVIEPAIAELHAKAGIAVQFAPQKRGRSVRELVFFFEPVRQMSLPGLD